MKIVLERFPLPPSFNEQHAVVRNRLIKTAKARLFDAHVQLYAKKYAAKLKQARHDLTIKTIDHVLRVDMLAVFERSRLFTKSKAAESWVKSLDSSNRIKAAHDGLVKCLGIDDKYFWAGDCEKVWCQNPKDEQVIFTLTIYKPRSLQDINPNAL